MKKKSLSAYLKDYMMVLVLIALLAIFGILCPLVVGRSFLTASNLLNILGQNAYMVILGVGITFIMLGGAMDLSTGYLISTVGIAMALINQNSGFLVTVICGILLAVLLSAFNGAVYSWLRVFPFIITLATQYMLNGATYLLSGGLSKTYRDLSTGFTVLGGYNIPIGIGYLKSGVIVMILMVILGSFILNKTYFGRNVYALGSNPDAVALSGVSVA
jgi:ribose/xylose/arabinose/galactoside ABC-type transport system permease subunit